eukprot:10348777-Alexandrium_andersonii.AAC.1
MSQAAAKRSRSWRNVRNSSIARQATPIPSKSDSTASCLGCEPPTAGARATGRPAGGAVLGRPRAGAE